MVCDVSACYFKCMSNFLYVVFAYNLVRIYLLFFLDWLKKNSLFVLLCFEKLIFSFVGVFIGFHPGQSPNATHPPDYKSQGCLYGHPFK